MSSLLSFHKAILEKIHDPSTSELLLIGRGLGLRRIVCKLLQIYDSPQSLVVLVNASPEEASAIGEELGVLGCRRPGLRLVDFETSKRDRQDLYKKGGLISVTSQIFTVDMLTSDIPTHLITGVIMLHAERVSPSSSEAFIARLYREKNKTGFLKAFTDQPEHITSGMSPLRVILKELQLRTVHIYPRFHQEVSESLGRDRSVLQLSVDMTEYMSEIHVAIVQCMSSTLSELKRSNTQLDLDDLNVENTYFKSFDIIVRRQLDPVWHKVGPRTKQLVSDLSTLRRLLNLLLTEDAFAFQQYLEGLIDANTTNEAGNARHNQSPWMLTEAANVIFQYAKRRCYTIAQKTKPSAPAQPVDENEDEWDAIRELEGGTSSRGAAKKNEWPEGMQPVLEELPKWSLVAAALQEIEEEMIRRETKLTSRDPGTNTVLIMTSSIRSAQLLREFLGEMDPDADPGAQGRRLMEDNLRAYLARQAMKKAMQKKAASAPSGASASNGGGGEVSEALKRKDRERDARIASRRRVRGGAPVVATSRGAGPAESLMQAISQQDEMIIAALPDILMEMPDPTALLTLGDDFDTEYGMLAPEQTIIVRAYSDDSDDTVLAEIQPRFVIMYEPNLDFVRRLEVYKKSTPGLGVRVYLMYYNNSCEEAKYLTDVRREKDAFERLIKERGSMLMPILEERRPTDTNDSLLRTISSRIAGGRKDVTAEPPRVIVDMREFRSSLPSLLHTSGILVIPATLTVGDYVLNPDMCVERKSIPDLVSSFNSGRLYTQCEMMSAHYKHPILLIEWEENKSFSLETVQELKQYAKPSNKYPKKKQAGADNAMSTYSIQAKLVLLTLTFPRVRIIWSSSPYATAAIFNDLKLHNMEPDAAKAIMVGAEDDSAAGAGVNHAAEELLRALPGVNAQTARHIMSKVASVGEFCALGLKEMQNILGVEPGKTCYEFIHRGERKKQGAEKG